MQTVGRTAQHGGSMEKKLLVTVPDENSMDFEAMIALMSIGLDVTIEAPTEAAQQSVHPKNPDQSKVKVQNE